MRESFARRVALFLVLLLLIAVITSKGGPYHSAFAAVLDQVGLDDVDDPVAAQADDSIVTMIVLRLEEASRDHAGSSGVAKAYSSR